MTNKQIESFICYWNAANLVAFNEIRSIEDMRIARRFCSVMTAGVTAWLGDDELFEALESLRRAGVV